MSAVKGRVLCVSWDPSLERTRRLLFSQSGYEVTSALGRNEAEELCKTKADVLVLGHSVPRDEKRRIADCFRQYNTAPVISVLASGQGKLPEVEFGVENFDPAELLGLVDFIVSHNGYF